MYRAERVRASLCKADIIVCYRSLDDSKHAKQIPIRASQPHWRTLSANELSSLFIYKVAAVKALEQDQ